MSSFFKKISLFLILCVALDKVVGGVGNYLVCHAKSGMTEKNEYICHRTCEDILVLGSSRAVHHYNPLVIEDSLGLSCYNCAYDGCGSITGYGLLRILIGHYTPKMILYEVTPGFDYFKSDKDNTKYLGPLKMYYDSEGIDTIFIWSGRTEKYKMVSNMYRMNSKFLEMLTENLMKRNETIKGYIPIKGKMLHEPDIMEKNSSEFDLLKIDCLNRIITLCKQKGIKLVFYASPSYMKTNDEKYNYIKKVSKATNIPFVNHYCDSSFVKNRDFFYDSAHMNELGAEKYTQHIISELKVFL